MRFVRQATAHSASIPFELVLGRQRLDLQIHDSARRDARAPVAPADAAPTPNNTSTITKVDRPKRGWCKGGNRNGLGGGDSLIEDEIKFECLSSFN